jgi:hypothetical protein
MRAAQAAQVAQAQVAQVAQAAQAAQQAAQAPMQQFYLSQQQQFQPLPHQVNTAAVSTVGPNNSPAQHLQRGKNDAKGAKVNFLVLSIFR